MIIDGHEGKDKDVEKLFKKYKIPPEDRVMAKNLLFCVKDADAGRAVIKIHYMAEVMGFQVALHMALGLCLFHASSFLSMAC